MPHSRGGPTGYTPPPDPSDEIVIPRWEFAPTDDGFVLRPVSSFGRHHRWVVAACIAVPVVFGLGVSALVSADWFVWLLVGGAEFCILLYMLSIHLYAQDVPDLADFTRERGSIKFMRSGRELAVRDIARFEVVSVTYAFKQPSGWSNWVECHLVCCSRTSSGDLVWHPIIGGAAGSGGWSWRTPKDLAAALGVPLSKPHVVVDSPG
ncbi:MAG: hypothetical protein ACOYN0_13990 [Phycisphaerales bacterium]